MKKGRSLFAGIFVFLVFSPLITNISFAIRPEEPRPFQTNNANRSQRAASIPAAPAKPTTAQSLAAEDLNKSGINVNWDRRINSPFSVSGENLESAASGSVQRMTSVATAPIPERSVAILQNFASLYGIQDPANEIRPVGKEEVDDLGFRHQRVSQTYKGIPVVGADLKVHFNQEGKAYQISGRTIPGIHLDPNPSLTGEQAVKIAEADFIAKGFEKPDVKNKPTLVIYGLGSPPLLAYQLEVSDSPMRVIRYWIDAKSGKIIKSLNRVCHGKTTLNGKLLAGEGGGSKSFDGWYESGYYLMINEDKFHLVLRYDYPTDEFNYAYKAQSSWGSSVNDRQEVSVAFNVAKTMDYFKDHFERSSVNGEGLFIYAVAIQNMGYVNAFWDGINGIWFGDGDGIDANSLAVLDICGHEFTHGVTQFSADLIYEKESGALNESFSDIFGANVEFAYQSDNRGAYPNKSNGTADWFCGEDAWKSSRALRDMRNPSNTTTVGTGNEQPKRYQGLYWFDIEDEWDYGGVHVNSGVQNFFYYLLCEGGSGNNEGISYNLTGIGISDAEQIAYRALTVYCTATTDYPTVRSAWISAAQDLDSSWVPRVKAAWDAVDVGRITINSLPSASSITYGQTVDDSILSGGSAFADGNEISGSFAWTTPAHQPTSGTKPISVTFVPDDSYYSSVNASVSLLVEPKSVTGIFTASDKMYDGAITATVASRSVSGKFGSDNVNLTGGAATFADAAAGTGKIVTLTGANLTGSAATNYTLGSVSTTTANITAKPLTGIFTASNKVYDGTTAAAVASRSVIGKLGRDDVNHTGGSTTFDSASAGNGKIVALTGATLTGAAAGNYTLGTIPTTKANITKKNLTGTFTAANKEYNGNNAATPTSREVSGKVGSDDVNHAGGTATFASSAVGNGKTVTLAGATLTGSAAANYMLGSISTATANITPKALTGSFVASSKVYDGNMAATVTSRSVSGKVGSDNVSLNGGTASFADANTGNGKTVTLTGAALTGSAAGNYTLTSIANITANITAKALTGTLTVANKEYDGNNTATILVRDVNGKVGGEDVTHTGGTATFNNATAGNNKTVTLTGATLTGPAAGNYILTSVATTKANITKKTLTASFSVANKEYNGNSAATVTNRTVTGKIGSDNVNHSGGTATFNNSSAGSGKTVNLTGASLTGSAAGNYTLGSVTPTTANITAKALTGTFSASNKVYDTTTTATVATRSVNGKVGSDNVNHTGGTATFNSASVGTGKTVSLAGATLIGTAAANYTLSSVSTTKASITKANPVIVAPPTASNISLGQSLNSSNFSGGQAQLGGTPVAGTFAWENKNFKPAKKGITTQKVRFTPSDTVNLSTITINLNVKVN